MPAQTFSHMYKAWQHRFHDGIDFVPLLQEVVRLMPISMVVADHGYDSEQNHITMES